MAVFTGTGGNDLLTGGDEDDLLRGLEGDDTLDGGGGIDTLEGGAGDDWLIVGQDDIIVELGGQGIDTAVWTGTGRFVLAAHVEHAIAGGTEGVEIAGNALDNDITGYNGGFGKNTLEGGDGDDTLRGGNFDDSLDGGAGDDLLLGQAEPFDFPTIDQLDGGAGNDTMIGGDKYDNYWADSLGDVIVENATPVDLDPTEDYESGDRVYWTGTGVYVQPLNVEFLHLRGGAVQALGNAQANTLTSDYGEFDGQGNEIGDESVTIDGAGGDDVIYGGSGLDSLLGGAGDDYVYAGDSGDTVAGGVGDDYLLGDNFMNFFDFGDDLLLGQDGNDILDGNIDNDTLDGGDGADALIGGAGDDMLTGGAGADRFAGGPNSDVALDYVDGEDFILGEFTRVTISQDGADTLIFFPGEFDEEDGTLRLIGIDATTITAADFQEFIQGTIDDDFLEGGGGADFLAGGAGNDDIEAGDGADASDGGSGDDRILGGSGGDDLAGGAGRDTLDGGRDGDRMAGGAGDDLYIVDSTSDLVTEVRVGGLDRVEASISYTLGRGVEELLLVSPGAARTPLDGAGNELDNRLVGTKGANALSGLDGADRLHGLEGDDSLSGGNGADRFNGGNGADRLNGGTGGDMLAGGDGIDAASYVDAVTAVRADLKAAIQNTGEAAGDTYIEVEQLIGSGFNDSLLGNNKANGLFGLSGDDSLDGRLGADSLDGARGNDYLNGAEDADTMRGAGGQDTLRGGNGADLFVLDSALTTDRDTILDFAGPTDEIALSGIAFGLAPGALDPDAFVIGSFAADAEDRIIYTPGDGKLFFDPDGAGGQAQILIATLSNLAPLTASEFVVI